MNPQDFYKRWGAVASEPEYQFELTQQGLRPRGQQVRPQAQATPKTKGNSLLKTLLSITGGTLGGIAGTFIAPGVGTAVGAGLGSGLGTAAGRAIGGEAVIEDGGLGEIALDTALGGAFSGFGKVGKLAKAGQEATEAAGKTAIKEVSQGAATAAARQAPQEVFGKIGRAGIRAGEKELGLQEGAKLSGRYLKPSSADELYKFGREQIGLAGSELTSPGLAVRKVNDYKTALLKPLEDSLQASNKIFDTKDYNAILKQARGTYGLGVDPASKTVKSIEANVRNSIVKGGIPELNKTRQGLDEMINYARKEGSVDPVREQVASALRRAVDDRLTQLVPNSKAIRGNIGKAYQLEELAYQAATKEARPINGVIDLAQRVAQNTGARAGGNTTLQGALGTLSSGNLAMGKLAGTGTSVLGQTGRQALRGGITNGVMGGMQQPQADPMMEDPAMTADMIGMNTTGMEDMAAQDDFEPIRQQLQMAMLEDLQTTGGENVSALKTVLGALEPEKESVSSKNAAKKLSQALGTVDTLQQQFEAAGGGQSYGGYGASLLGALKMNPQAGAYNDMRGGFLSQVSKALGESGVLTDQDIARVRNLVPDLADNPEQAAIKWQALRQVLSGSMGTPSMVGTDTRFNQEVY